jgi:phage/plasmid-like protein (TIGR03299 family)
MARPTLPGLDSSAPAVYDAAERSAYSVSYLRDNIRIGFTDERGPAWHANQIIGDDGQPAYLADGTHFPGPVPLEEVEKMLKIVLEERPLFYQDASGEYVPVERYKGIGIKGRDDLINCPRDSYVIHQYFEALHKFTQRVAEGALVSSVGTLKNGAVAFLQAVLPEEYEVAGYGYTPYITAATSADSSIANTYLTGAIGAVCDNTLDSAMAGALSRWKIKHTRKSVLRAQEAREKLGLSIAQVGDEMTQTIESLLAIPVSERDFELWLDEVTPMPDFKETKSGTGGRGYTMAENKRNELSRLWVKDPKVKPWAGTAFGIVQASNTWNTWSSTVRNADGGRIERNYLNAIEGKVGAADRKALDALAKVQLGSEDNPKRMQFA